MSRNSRNSGSSFMDKGRQRVSLKDHMLQELGNYLT